VKDDVVLNYIGYDGATGPGTPIGSDHSHRIERSRGILRCDVVVAGPDVTVVLETAARRISRSTGRRSTGRGIVSDDVGAPWYWTSVESNRAVP
jgi:hypothetical protein